MSMWQRFKMIFSAKANKALDKAEDPRETLDHAYRRQVELLGQARRGLADVATSKKRVELQVNQLQAEEKKLYEQAQRAIGMGREDLAREALQRRSGLHSQIEDLEANVDHLSGEEERLQAAVQGLNQKIEGFRTRKETLKATYTAAQAQTRISEAFSGISDDMGDVGAAVERSEEKIREMKARSSAVDELMASGALDGAFGENHDPIARELRELSSSSDVESELAALKALPSSAPKQIEG